MLIGLISDTHIPEAGPDLWPQVYQGFQDVDLIMHAGDLHVPEVLDWLGRLAPVVAVWGNGDYQGWERREPPSDPRLCESRLLKIEGLRIGLVHDFPLTEWPPLQTTEGLIKYYFGGPVDVIVRGNTHRAEIVNHKGVLVINPGSPSFPDHKRTQLGTIGFLEVRDGVVNAYIKYLSELPEQNLLPGSASV